MKIDNTHIMSIGSYSYCNKVIKVTSCISIKYNNFFVIFRINVTFEIYISVEVLVSFFINR